MICFQICTCLFAGTYSCLRSDFKFVRESGHYMQTFFFPSIFIIIIAWSSFWISRQQTTARILILLFSFATMLNLTSNFNSTAGSSVSYTICSDVWIFACLMFILFAHLEYMTVHYLSKNETEKEAELGRRGFKILKAPMTWFKESRWGEIIDIVSRIGYMLVFVIFSCWYFAVHKNNDPFAD